MKVLLSLHEPLFRGPRRLRIALVGMEGAGARTIFHAIESARPPYEACDIDIGLDQARVVKVPPGAAVPAADVIVQVIDVTAPARHLELTRELRKRGIPLVIAANKMDAARSRGIPVSTRALGHRLGLPVVPTIGSMGYGIRELFTAAVDAARGMPRPERSGKLPEKLDRIFLHPRWGLAASAAVFAAALFVVFDLSVRIDAATTAPLAQWVSLWQPADTPGVVLRAVADGLVGLAAIVIPYMIPLVLLLIVLEQSGVMARIAFAVDRVFHRIGLHGDLALPLLLGLGCNVPALSAIGAGTRGADRTISAVLVTFVPCSARSAIILALAGKYLGALGVLAVFAVAALVIAVLGRVLRRYLARGMRGHLHDIPPYALPRPASIARETWLRTRDILTIVTPLLVGGSVVLALLSHAGADRLINAVLAPVTSGWLGLPAVLGLPLLFGVLRKELSLAMIATALGSADVGAYLDRTQIFTFLVFLTLYVPCISTFAVLAKVLGRRQALASVGLSVGVALVAAGMARFGLRLLA